MFRLAAVAHMGYSVVAVGPESDARDHIRSSWYLGLLFSISFSSPPFIQRRAQRAACRVVDGSRCRRVVRFVMRDHQVANLRGESE